MSNLRIADNLPSSHEMTRIRRQAEAMRSAHLASMIRRVLSTVTGKGR